MTLDRRTRRRAIRWVVYASTVLFLAWLVVTIDWATIQEKFFDPEIIAQQFPEIITVAAWHTLIFTFYGYSIGLVLGLILALMRLSTVAPYRWFAAVYIEIFRGVPLLVTLLVIGYGIPIAFGGAKVPFTYGPGSIALGLVAAAYMAESIRAGIVAVPKGQMEAARSLGMPHSTAMRRIVVPQAFRIILPPLTNELVLLIKDTSLVSVLGVTLATRELTFNARDLANQTLNLTPYTTAAFVYLCMTVPLTLVAGRLERRAGRAR